MNTMVTATTAAPAYPRALSATLAYFGAFIAQGMILGALGPTLPGLAANVGAPLSALSWLFAARALGALGSSAQSGRLYDRWPGHPILAASLLACAVLLALLPLAANLWLLVALVTLLGSAVGVINLGGNTLLAWVHRERSAPYMSALHFFFGVGAFLSPLLVAWLTTASGDNAAAFWALALAAAPVAVWLLCMPSPDNRPAPADESDEPVDHRLIALFVVFFFVYVGAEVSFGSWIYSYAIERGLGDAATGAYLTSAFWGALTAGRLLAVFLAARLRPRVILAADLIGALAGVALILALPGSLAALWAGTLLAGFFMASVFPTALSFVQRRIPVTGRVTGYFLMGAMGGSIVLPWLIGVLMAPLGVGVVMIAIIVDLLLAVLVFTALLLGWREPVRAVKIHTR